MRFQKVFSSPCLCAAQSGLTGWLSFDGEAATAFLHFSADYFRVLAQRYGEPIRLEVDGNRLVADFSQAPAPSRLPGGWGWTVDLSKMEHHNVPYGNSALPPP